MTQELIKAHHFRNRMRSGEVLLGAQVALTDPSVIEILGNSGYDWIVIDTEHSAINPETVKSMLQASVGLEATTIVRVNSLAPQVIRTYLDLGSPGILCPFIESGEDARRLVEACRYPPDGFRGFGPKRAAVFGTQTKQYLELANESMLCIPIIESQRAVDNIDEIVSQDGIDGLTIGPMDLSNDLGVFQQFDDPAYIEAVQKVREACERHGKAMGTGCYSLEHGIACIEAGDTLLLAAGDDQALQQGAAAIASKLRETS